LRCKPTPAPTRRLSYQISEGTHGHARCVSGGRLVSGCGRDVRDDPQNRETVCGGSQDGLGGRPGWPWQGGGGSLHRASIARAAPFSRVRVGWLKPLTWSFVPMRTTLNPLWPNLQAGGRGFESHRLHPSDQRFCPQNGSLEGPEVGTREHLGNIRSHPPSSGWVRGQNLPPELQTGSPDEQRCGACP
jgi:hypothetical protein